MSIKLPREEMSARLKRELALRLFALQAIMGHSNLETTKHYIALVEADIREAQEKASPNKRLVGRGEMVR
ncbi:hypothetical protein [Acetomicrobium sp.]|uniref:hypothetical protein n=1 Tax=Acetomicrobium sp. TaxID=1872099 RepID=UPI001BCDCBD0|nr:hypothetical protein [Acetomicrobium sp.]